MPYFLTIGRHWNVPLFRFKGAGVGMAIQHIQPVILAGGAGTRLWPVSRKSYPKQFSKIIGDASLYQQAARRMVSSNRIFFDPHITMTNNDFRFTVAQQLAEIDVDQGSIIIEPMEKNTAASVLAACFYAMKSDPDAVLLVAPSDHVIPNQEAFHDAVLTGLEQTAHGKIVTLGITPTRAETGYGYLELETTAQDGVTTVSKFVEKPDQITAEMMVAAGYYLWNAGIFLFRAADMVAAFEIYAPHYLAAVGRAVDHGVKDLGFYRLDAVAWSECDDQSIDYAVMEHAQNLVCVTFHDAWNDLGDWGAVWTHNAADGADDAGVVRSANALAIDCHDSLLRSESDDQQIVGLGLKDIIAVAMPDAVLVAHKDHAQRVKAVVPMLRSKQVRQADAFPKDHRPWGWYETLALRDRFQVKRIMVHPGAALSLQSHHHRSEHWIVVEGTAKVTVDDMVKLITEGQSVFIPLGAVHRMENPGKMPLVLIEVQTGGYLAEDDIVRYDDKYARI
jgi:mannose-1-phosphate guanylyltransferase/mannose-6-phosphate isomerase